MPFLAQTIDFRPAGSSTLSVKSIPSYQQDRIVFTILPLPGLQLIHS